jgi:hypothetical protein
MTCSMAVSARCTCSAGSCSAAAAVATPSKIVAA